jgi:hypothetical protein
MRVLLIIAAIMVSGCKTDVTSNGMNVINPSEVCIKGIVYYDSRHRLAPAYSKDGNLMFCN